MTADFFARLATENVQPRPRRGGWHGGPTPVGALRGVDADMAWWRPAPERKNIWELTLHIAYWKYAVRRRLQRGLSLPEQGDDDARFPLSPANWPVPPATADQKLWSEHVVILRREHERLVAVISTVSSDQYEMILPGGRRWSVGELILGVAQHDAYHTGQIQLLKRLWSSLGGDTRAARQRRR